MGVIVDTCVFISFERRGAPAYKLQERLYAAAPDERFIVSYISIAELVHGVYRANTVEQRVKRIAFVREVGDSFPSVSFTDQTAWIAGRVRGEQSKLGNTLPFADSLIAATALEMDYTIVTSNVADFVRIPDLRVLPF